MLPNTGLTEKEAQERLLQYGPNELVPEKKQSLFRKILDVLKEPMFLLLLVASAIYFVLGEAQDGAIMLVFVVFVIGIDVVQEWKTDKTLRALKNLSSPKVTVLRDKKECKIDAKLLVPGDVMLVSEGEKLAADGKILSMNDLCVDESAMTGESEMVWKSLENTEQGAFRRDWCYAGSIVIQGSAYVLVEKTGAVTEYGKIGTHIAEAPDMPTPLQKQTGKLVMFCAILGCILFVLVGIATFISLSMEPMQDRVVHSILSGITLAMAMIPEEFPVILTVFLSMGAWRLARKHALVRRMPSVETLGAVTVLCVDKTGTLTENQMKVQRLAPFEDHTIEHLSWIMGMACEENPYDPMEKAILQSCEKKGILPEKIFSGKLLHEYPFTSKTKRMGHVWQTKEGDRILCAKGSPESILPLCSLSKVQLEEMSKKQKSLAEEGLRVLAVASAKLEGDIPEDLEQSQLVLEGLIGLADPPRKAVPDAVRVCQKAGVRVVMITGDNGVTATSIARQIGLRVEGSVMTGEELDQMDDEELKKKLPSVDVFARVVPEHKMRIVKLLRELGEVVAMTGDGVNDAPALKYADIGIAMGKRGTEVARESADMILMDDNFSSIVETIRDGRRIFDNIRKAIGYVFVIHIPIALAALFAPMLGIPSDAIMLLPLHVVVMELVIDPTCSIVFERQPEEPDIMDRPPRDPKQPLVTKKVVIKSVIQGLLVFLSSFGVYLFTLHNNPLDASLARSMGLAVLMLSNLFLVYVNSEERRFAYRSFLSSLKDKPLLAINGGVLLMLLIILYTPLNQILKLAPLSGWQFGICLLLAAVSVLWYELIKLGRKIKNKRKLQR